jgi:hypothetical protein
MTVACLLGMVSVARAQGAAQSYEMQKKSVGLAVTLEALSPVAGVGAFYAHDSDRGLTLAITSALAAGAGVASAFWLVHLDRQHETGVDRFIQDSEQGTAISLLVVAGVVYVVARVSGLELAPEATGAYNQRLRESLGVPREPVVTPQAFAPGTFVGARF